MRPYKLTTSKKVVNKPAPECLNQGVEIGVHNIYKLLIKLDYYLNTLGSGPPWAGGGNDVKTYLSSLDKSGNIR